MRDALPGGHIGHPENTSAEPTAAHRVADPDRTGLEHRPVDPERQRLGRIERPAIVAEKVERRQVDDAAVRIAAGDQAAADVTGERDERLADPHRTAPTQPSSAWASTPSISISIRNRRASTESTPPASASRASDAREISDTAPSGPGRPRVPLSGSTSRSGRPANWLNRLRPRAFDETCPARHREERVPTGSPLPNASSTTRPSGSSSAQPPIGVGIVGDDRLQLADDLAVDHPVALVDQVEAAVVGRPRPAELEPVDGVQPRGLDGCRTPVPRRRCI